LIDLNTNTTIAAMTASGSPVRAKRPRHLFTPKRKIAEQSMREGAAPAAESVHKPRILAILPAAPVCHEEPEAPISPKQTSEIARSQFARIRTWVRYGVTVHQVAEVYGVAVGEIERILRKA